ncbi:cobalamin B12-binding domain-containing protein [Novosphingobium sp.]|uniref:cobalamin B12-binding domain-containing protein n=1 Tax=Novosphingobium sp. TaxID=1874826 RepID=UPI003D0C1832
MATIAFSDANAAWPGDAGHASQHGASEFSARGSPSFDADTKNLAAFRVIATTDFKNSLSRLIENEVIPRLMLAHALETFDTIPAAVVASIVVGEAEALAVLVLQVDAGVLLAHVEAILARGVTVDTVLVDLLAPTARLLGEYWESDRCDFVDVTMGLWRLQEVVHVIAARAPSERLLAAGGHRALFASMPGDQHNFGTVVIDEMFRRDGWITDRLSGAETSELLRRVGEEWFDMIGLTVSCECHIATLPSVIVALRNVSKNSQVSIMVGGPVFSKDPGQAEKVGADGTAPDAQVALKVAAGLVRTRQRQALAGN